MIRKILIFGFPLFLVFLEMVLRKALNVDARVFLGPTFAAVGIGFAMPLTGTKDMATNLRPSFQRELRAKVLLVYSKRDVRFIGIVCIMLILMVSGWYCCLYYSLVSPSEVFYDIPIPLGLGVLIYVVGIVLSFIKDRISGPKGKI